MRDGRILWSDLDCNITQILCDYVLLHDLQYIRNQASSLLLYFSDQKQTPSSDINTESADQTKQQQQLHKMHRSSKSHRSRSNSNSSKSSYDSTYDDAVWKQEMEVSRSIHLQHTYMHT